MDTKYLENLQATWENLGKKDALWAILTYPQKKNGKWEIDEFFSDGKKEIDDLMNYISSLNVTISHQRALDFGCGVGRLTQALAQYFDEVCGVDIAPSMIDLANKYNCHESRCNYYLNNSNCLSIFPDKSFDFIFSKITLQHMKPAYCKKYISEFLRILAPTGVLIFQLPSERIQKISIPNPLLDIYRQLRYGSFRMEMHGMKQSEVVKFIEEDTSVEILNIKQDNSASAGDKWLSFQYCIIKK